MRGRVATLVLAVAGAFWGCESIPSSPQERSAVVSLTLVAEESLQIATITEAARADSALPGQPAVIGPARVALQVVDDSGTIHPLVFDSAAGRYSLALVPQRGARYGLHGSIDGRAVLGETTVPLIFDIASPAADTITEAHGAPCGGVALPLLCVPYVFRADGPTAFEYRVLSPSGTLQFAGALDGDTGVMLIPIDSGERSLVVLAYDGNAAEWLLRDTPRSNLSGAFGSFGAALLVRRRLVTR